MITYKPIIIPGGRRRDGTWPVKIRITFKCVSRRLPTTLVCTDQDLTRGGRIKNATILQRAGELIARMREATADLSPFTLEAWSVDQVVDHIRERLTGEDFRLDFFAFADGFLQSKSPSTRKSYDTALNTFARFLGRREVDINDITRKMLLDFQAAVDAAPALHRTKGGKVTETKRAKIPGGSSAHLTAKLAHIFAAARFRYNDEDGGRILIPRSPFDGLRKAYPPGHGQKPLEPDAVQRIINAATTSDQERIARAAFLLSLATMGANLADLYAAQTFTGDTWAYQRRKTAPRRADGAEVRVFMVPESYALIRDLGGLSGAPGWWLPALHRYKDPNTATAMVNEGLAAIADREGLEPFTFYAARHTWATQARRLGVEKATIDEALGHIGDYKVADIYAERNWRLAWDANAKVLARYSWPDNYRTISGGTDGNGVAASE